jgi:catalase
VEANVGATAQRPAGNPQQGGATNANERSMSKLPQKWAENLRDRSPEEQERFMQNNERFKSLPPAQQAQIRQNLQKWNSLSPTERNAIRDRQETWQRMSPEQRQYVQKSLLPKWQAMSPDRKQLVTGRLHTLQQMNPDQRAAALNDPRFMQGLSPDEQSVLRGLDSVRNPNP